MAFVSLANFLVVSLLACSSIAVYGDETLALHYPTAEAPHAPPPHHHHHHHPPTPPPSKPVTPPPSHPPTPPPSHPPTPPPSHTHAPPPSHPHTPPPSQPPTPPPSHPPAHPPVKPPVHPSPRKKVAVQGVVYCKSCKYRGDDTALGLGATPLAGAVVKLVCNNTKYGMVEQAKTDKNGYFFLTPQKLTTFAFHKCRAFLVSSPLPTCSHPTNLHGGAAGAILVPTHKPPVATPIKPESNYVLFTVGPFAFEPPKNLPCH